MNENVAGCCPDERDTCSFLAACSSTIDILSMSHNIWHLHHGHIYKYISHSFSLFVHYNHSNPTGAAATKEQLTDLVALCKERGSILVFDAAYAPFIRTPNVPKSIFEIDGAKDVAIEVNSFSKYAGFTGVRLGWTVVPKSLKYADGTPVSQDFNRVMTTAFNGASNIVQAGGLACLDDDGLKEIDVLIDYYLENASILRTTMEGLGFKGTLCSFCYCSLSLENVCMYPTTWNSYSYMIHYMYSSRRY
jgi:aspartate/methionine/tyrosine aminotransferase